MNSLHLFSNLFISADSRIEIFLPDMICNYSNILCTRRYFSQYPILLRNTHTHTYIYIYIYIYIYRGLICFGLVSLFNTYSDGFQYTRPFYMKIIPSKYLIIHINIWLLRSHKQKNQEIIDIKLYSYFLWYNRSCALGLDVY